MDYNNKIIKISKDRYGNIINRILNHNNYVEEITYKYNKYNDLIEYKVITINNGNKQESETIYSYEYDNFEHKSKMIQTNINLGKVINQLTIYYKNEYDKYQRIKQITQSYEDGSVNLVIKYHYNGELLEKKEECKNSFNQVDKTCYYQYTENGDLYEKKCYLKNDILSYFVRYKLLSDGRYYRQLLSPIKGKYSWLVYEVFNGMCSFYIKEESLSPKIIIEICDYAITKYPSYNFIRIDICESEDVTYRKELEEIENFYINNYNLTIIHDF